MWVDRTAFPSWAQTGMRLDSEDRLAYNACHLYSERQLFFLDLERSCQNKTIWGWGVGGSEGAWNLLEEGLSKND